MMVRVALASLASRLCSLKSRATKSQNRNECLACMTGHNAWSESDLTIDYGCEMMEGMSDTQLN